jgi:putative ABC transport system substrate-binding protein
VNVPFDPTPRPNVRELEDNRVRRIAVLIGGDENDPVWKPRLSAFTQALAFLGRTDDRNVRMELRWGRGDADRFRALARELVGLQPDIILTSSTTETAAVQRETRTIPIVFASVGDPVASGIVPRPTSPTSCPSSCCSACHSACDSFAAFPVQVAILAT